MVSDYWGHLKKTLINGGLGNLLSIAVFENKIYMSTEWGPRHKKVGKLLMANKVNGSHVETLKDNMHSVQGLSNIYF
jgi:hypothetical protein